MLVGAAFLLSKQSSNQSRPIHTYGERGTAKRGIDVEAHALIYMEGGDSNCPHEIVKEPLAVIPENGREKLHSLSLLNFSKVYTVEHNVKVKSVGRISDESMAYFNAYVKESFGY